MTRAVLGIGVLLWVIVSLGAMPFGRDAWLGAVIGGAVGLANFYGLSTIVAAMFRRRSGTKPLRGALLGLLLVSKFVLLCGIIWFALHGVGVSPIGFLAGISVVVISIFVASFGSRSTVVET